MDEGKVEAVHSWPIPRTIKDLQCFLGFAVFYRRFIRDYSSIAAPLTSLLMKGPRMLSWNEEVSAALSKHKLAFTSAAIVVHPNPELPFIVEMDASTSGVGEVLSRWQGTPEKLHPCAFFSTKLSQVVRGLPSALEMAEKIFQEVFRNFGLPEDIVSDRGPQLFSQVWKNLLKLLEVTVSPSSGCHPQLNAS